MFSTKYANVATFSITAINVDWPSFFKIPGMFNESRDDDSQLDNGVQSKANSKSIFSLNLLGLDFA